MANSLGGDSGSQRDGASTSSNLRKLQKETDAFAMYPSGRLICLFLGVFLKLTTTLIHLS